MEVKEALRSIDSHIYSEASRPVTMHVYGQLWHHRWLLPTGIQ